MYLSSTITTNITASHIISNIASVLQEVQVCAGHWLPDLEDVVVQRDVVHHHLLAQLEELVGDRVVVAVVLEVLPQHLLVVGLARREYYRVFEDVLCEGNST